MQDQISFIIGEIRSALRFRWIGIGVASVICVGGWIYVATLPNIYEAQARFFLNTSSMLERALQDQIISTDPESRLAYIRESLFGRNELESVARTVGLDADVEGELGFEILLNRLRNEILFEPLSQTSLQQTPDRIYQLSYRHHDRLKAIAVLEELLATFIAGTEGDTRRDEDNALDSLQQQVALAEDDLAQAERERARFRRENADRLPGAQGDFQRRMESVEHSLTEARRNLNALESRLEREQEEIENLRAFLPNTPAEIDPNSLPGRIRAYQLEYDEKSLRFQPDHQELLRLRAAIATMTEQREAELQAAGAEGVDPRVLALEANPVYQEAQLARAETESSIAERQAEITDLEDELARLIDRRDESLANEAALAEFDRKVTEAREKLDDFVQGLRALETTRAVETASQVRFRPIDEPFSSPIPVEPGRLKLLVFVFVGGLGIGGTICYGLAQLQPIFSNSRSLQQFAELPVLGAITNAWPVSQQTRFRRAAVGFSAAVCLLFLTLFGLAGMELYGPGIHSLVTRG